MATHARPAAVSPFQKTAAKAAPSRARADRIARSAAAHAGGSERSSRDRRTPRARRHLPSARATAAPSPVDVPPPAAIPRPTAPAPAPPSASPLPIGEPLHDGSTVSVSPPGVAPVEAPAAITPETGSEAGDHAADPVRAAAAIVASAEEEISSETGRFSFPSFLDALLPPPPRTVVSSGGVCSPARLAAIQEAFEQIARDSSPLLSREAHLVEEFRAASASMLHLLSGRVSPPTDHISLFDWRVRVLLGLNYQHVVKTHGRPKARTALRELVNALTSQGTTGRPATIPRSQLQALRQHWAAGQSVSQIAETLGLNQGTIRTALRYHFRVSSTKRKNAR